MRKKLLMTLLVLFCMLGGVFAEAFSPIDGTKYKLSCSRGSLTVNVGQTSLQSSYDAKTTVANYDAAYQFTFELSGESYYMKNVAANKYVTNTGALVADIASASAISFRDWEDGTYQPYWDDSHNLNLGGSNQVAIGTWKTKDAGDQWTIAAVDAPSYIHITDLSQLSNDKAYVLVCQRGQLTTNANAFGSKATLTDPADDASKFAIINNSGTYYLWSVACRGYAKSDKTILAENPQALALTKQNDNTFLGVLNAKGLNVQSGGTSIIINDFVTPDDGNKFNIYEVGDFDNSIVFAPIRTEASTKIHELANVPLLFSSDAISAAINAVNNATNIDQVTAAMQTLYATANDKKIVFYNTNRDNKYMVVVDAIQLAGTDVVDGRSEFKINYANGTDGQFIIQNTATGRFIANTPAASNRIQLSKVAGKFTIKNFGTENKIAFISVNPTNTTHNSLHLDAWHDVVAWEADNDGNASVWVIQESGLTPDEIAAGVTAVKNQAIAVVTNYKNNLNPAFGTGLGEYSATSAYTDAVAAIESANTTMGFEEIMTLKDNLQNAADNLSINLPQDGTFLRMKSNVGQRYITITENHATATPVQTKAGASIDNIFFYTGSKLLAYATGLYLNGDNHAVLGNSSNVTFSAAVTGTKGVYAIKPTGNHWYDNGEGININHWNGGNHANCEWIIEAVTELPIKMTQVGTAYYSTINLPVAVTLPEGLKAYSASVDGTTLNLTKVVEGDVLAASTPVVLYSEADVTSLAISSEAGTAADDNALSGTVAKIAKPAGTNYVLAKNNDNAVFGKYTGENIPGFKAYYNNASSSVAAFNFNFEDVETAIQAIENADNKLEIFDMNGRRVQKAQKGIYVVNGKKVIFK